MFKIYSRPFTVVFFVIVVCEIKTSEVPRPRGVSLSRLALYSPEKDFTCLDGSKTIPFVQVNDDYCDCEDGTDEPGTSACPQGMFYCTNAGHRPLSLPSSRVNDGICDCCDASDEYAFPDSNCVNNCNELGRTARIEAQRKAELLKIGSQIRAELSQKGVLLKQEKKEKLVLLHKNREEAEQIKKEKEQMKKEAEDLENQALAQYRIIEEEQKRVKQEEEAKKFKDEALDAFHLFDSNEDGRLQVSELQTRPTFDRDRDGEITREEAEYFLDGRSEIEFQDFFEISWPKIKPLHMMNAGIFTPPQSPSASTEQTDDVERDVDATDDPDELPEDERTEFETDEEEDEETEHEEEEPAKEPEPETQIQYDEETQKLISRADEARNEFNAADRTSRDVQNEIRNIEESLDKDYGAEEEFAILDGQCFEYTDREYLYKLCPFDQVTQQPKSGGMDTKLGTWGSWAGTPNKYDTMLYERGASCWNGPQRSAHVRVRCGGENVVMSVGEPNRCEYLLEFSTPAACDPAGDDNGQDAHDEL